MTKKSILVKGRQWTQEDVKALLTTSDRAVKRALVVIWERQTEAEKVSNETHENNGIGFNGVDAFILSRFVEQMKEKGTREKQNWKMGEAWLSPKQMVIARKKIMKYSGQIHRIMLEKIHNQARQLNLID